MVFDLAFFMSSIAFGTGLAMDAFSVSLANGLGEPKMKTGKMCGIAGLFAFFQALMPILGWICMHTLLEHFKSFEKFIPWIALILLLYIGGKMLIDGIKNKDCECDCGKKLTISALIIQGIATSIDALSVGVTQASYNLAMELVSSLIIAAVTFVICMAGIFIGKKFGTHLAGKAAILGGIILIVIGIQIFLTGIL
ncbi:MAG: manganese efflux pump [Clostridia bacterium]|nr:manganese efflux pump [Clostridia bacterium]